MNQTHLKAETVHFEKHFAGEEHDEEEVGDLLEVVEPGRLAVVLRGQHASVQEDQYDNDPKHGLTLDGFPAGPSGPSVGLLHSLLFLLPPG